MDIGEAMDALIKAKLAEIAALAEQARIKAERNQHWEGELSDECNRIANLAREVAQFLRIWRGKLRSQ